MKRLSKFLIILLLVAILLPQIMVEAAEASNGIERIFGRDRIETSLKISKAAYPGESKAETVFIAGYNGDADALTATFIAAKTNAPLLLTYKDKLDANLLSEIHRLDAKNVVILGGVNTVSKNVEDGLRVKGYNTRRITGKSRIETAVNIALDYYKESKVPEVFVVEYSSLADALAIGPVSADKGIPVLITRKDSVPNEVIKFLKDHNVDKATIIGGKNAISDRGSSALANHVSNVDRIYGSNRVETSLKIAQKYFKDSNSIFVANGYKYADATIGGYFANIKKAPIILTSANSINKEALKYVLDSKCKPIIIGGASVVSTAVYNILGNIKTVEVIDTVSPKTDVETVSITEKEVVRLVNIERKSRGLPEFKMDAKLSSVARIKSKDMADKNYFSHTSPTYGSPFDMMKKFGISYRAAGENIAMGHTSAAAVVKGWMNSEGHKKNILNPSFNTIGVGAYSSSRGIYWTQMFTN